MIWPLSDRSRSMVCIYKHPKDYPDKYVARLFDHGKPTRFMVTADTLKDIQKEVPRGMGLKFYRCSDDDSAIFEIWM